MIPKFFLSLVLAALPFPNAIVPVHGFVLENLPGAKVVARFDAVPRMLPGGTSLYRVRASRPLRAGLEIDAYLDRTTRTLFDAKPAQAYVAGDYDPAVTHTLTEGDRVPAFAFIDQNDRLTTLDAFRGKVVLLSFVFTRCRDADACPLISAQFASMQSMLDPARFHLIEITLDPTYDSPPVLAAYAARFRADPARWSFFTGQPAEVKFALDNFGIRAIKDTPDDFVHSDRLVIVDPGGTVNDVITTEGWSPADVVAQARAADGLSSNPFRRFELASIARVVALCGGSQTAGVIVLDSAVFVVGVALLGSVLVWFGKKIWA